MTMLYDKDALREAEVYLRDSIIRAWGPPTKYQPQSNNASKCGHPCPYYLWAVRVRWDELPAPTPRLMGIFAQGREAERGVKQDLLREGWEVTHDEITFEDPQLQVRGRMDFYLAHPDGPPFWRTQRVPTEFKSVSPTYFDRLLYFPDLYDYPIRWVRLWPYQPLLYAYLAPEERPYVCLLLRNKSTRETRPLVARVDDHFDRLVAMGEVLAEVNTAIREAAEPRAIPYEPVWCEGCDAAHLCPTMRKRSYQGAVVVLDPDDASACDRLATAYYGGKDAAAASATAWDQLKELVRRLGGYEVVGGQRTLVGGQYRYTVKQGSKSARLSVVPVDAEE